MPPRLTRPAQVIATPSQTPHPAVVRIIAVDGNVKSLGSGTLVHVTDKHGLVITNWHVVRDAKGTVDVVFPDGFRSGGRVMKLDDAWDLAAIGIWRPRVKPVTLSKAAPRPGEVLTIAGYGGGRYRAATGRCTQYVAPGNNHPFEMVELSAEARQGDSGGPIFNDKGQLAGVLLGAKKGHTVGSFCGRVDRFLADVTPVLNEQQQVVLAKQPFARPHDALTDLPAMPRSASGAAVAAKSRSHAFDPLAPAGPLPPRQAVAAIGPAYRHIETPRDTPQPAASARLFGARVPLHMEATSNKPSTVIRLSDYLGKTMREQIKSVLAGVGMLALAVSFLRMFKFEDPV